jgi:hypothetical protein
MVNAVAIAAERASTIGLDWNIAFEHAYDALDRLDELWGDTDGWLGQLIDRAAADLGRVLSDSARRRRLPRRDDRRAMDVLGSTDADAVAFTVDWAMTTAADEGALAPVPLRGRPADRHHHGRTTAASARPAPRLRGRKPVAHARRTPPAHAPRLPLLLRRHDRRWPPSPAGSPDPGREARVAARIGTITGIALGPGVSRNGRLYTAEAIGRACARARHASRRGVPR